MAKLPSSVNSDITYLIDELLSEQSDNMSWREIGLCLQSIGETSDLIAASWPELVWSGPATEIFPVRRIDQVLYDLVREAREQILLVTFAAAKIERLRNILAEVMNRGVEVNLVLEFESESEGQLSCDALAAFSDALARKANIYYWPHNRRERNEGGRPGKLHAKCAVIDEKAIISSANLTDDAFNRNMELGVLFKGGSIPQDITEHFRSLIMQGIFVKLRQ